MKIDQQLAKLEVQLAARRERKMGDYKVVPVEPTAEMVQAFKAMWSLGFCDDRMAQECYAAIIDAAPAVQGEPVAFCEDAALSIAERTFSTEVDEQLASDIIQYAQRLHSLYAAPHPAEPQPSAGDSLTSVPDEVFAAEFAAWWDEQGQFCRAGGGTYERTFAFEAWRHLYPQLMNLQMAAAEQQPAPTPTFQLGDHVRKTRGSQWKGRVVGTYSTSLTPEGYAVESDTEKGSVQIYPVGALELVAAHRKQEST